MSFLPDGTLAHLRQVVETPDLTATCYEPLDVIGRGGMGVVFRARDRRLERDVALKVLAGGPSAGSAAARLAREARILARLEHPGIVPVHDAGVLPDGRTYYVMKLVRGEPLDVALRRGVSFAERLRIFGRACEAIAFAHARGVIHRDLKPSNVMIGAFGEVLVLDWGVASIRDAEVSAIDLAADRQPDPTTASVAAAAAPTPTSGGSNRFAPASERPTAIDPDHDRPTATVRATGDALDDTDGRLTGAGDVVGTPGYMAPEQARGDARLADERADVYALGAMLRELIAAEPRTRAGTPRALSAICDKAQAAEPGGRYQSVQALADDVSRFVDGHAIAAWREPMVERLRRFLVRHRVAIVLVLAYLAMRAVLLWLGGS